MRDSKICICSNSPRDIHYVIIPSMAGQEYIFLLTVLNIQTREYKYLGAKQVELKKQKRSNLELKKQ